MRIKTPTAMSDDRQALRVIEGAGISLDVADDGQEAELTIGLAGAGSPTFGSTPVFGSNGWDYLRSVFDVRSYGALGDGATDDTEAIQAAIDACLAAGGGIVWFAPGTYLVSASLVPGRGVAFVGAGVQKQSVTAPNASLIKAPALAAPIIDGGATAVEVTITGLSFQGAGAVSGSKGIYAADCGGWLIRDCMFDSFGDQAIHLEGGNDPVIDNVFVQNAVLVRSGRTGYVGAVHVSSNDAMLSKVKATTSSTGNDSGSGWISGIVIDGENNFAVSCMGHMSETGIVVTAASTIAGTRLVACRSDLNYTNGFVILGTRNELIGCWSYRDGQAANNTYDSFLISGHSNSLVGCRAIALGADAARIRYGFNNSNSNATLLTSFTDCRAVGMVTKDILTTVPSVASAATITIPDTAKFVTVTGTTTITSIAAGFAGERVKLKFAGALTLTDGGNLELAGDFVTTAGDSIVLTCDGTNWNEDCRSAN